MSRVTVYHLTPVRRLPLIEEEGLRTRADLSERFGPIGPEDEAAPGRFAHGKRVSAFLDRDHAGERARDLGAGLITFTVDPSKAIAMPASARDEGDAAAYWEASKPLAEWMEGDAPADLEVHVHVPVRAKFVNLHAPLLAEDEMGDYAPLVAAVADEDRLSAKALMHLAIIASEGEFDSPAFRAACALAWRDEPDDEDIIRDLMETDPDKVASAALAEYGSVAPEATEQLRVTLDETRSWGDDNGIEHGRSLFARTALVLEALTQSA